MNAEGQMDRGFIERFSGVNAAARHIKHIAGRQDQLRRGRKTFPYKYLALLQFAARHIAFLFVDMPALRSLDLEDDDVMIVIMRQKALRARRRDIRSEEHTSELQSLMRISYAVFCLKKKTNITTNLVLNHSRSPT